MKNAERLAAENEAKRTATSFEDAAKSLKSMPESKRNELVRIAAEQETVRLKAEAEEAWGAYCWRSNCKARPGWRYV